MRTVVGQDLERLFAARDEGRVSEADFRLRKAALLDWSGCQLSRCTPKRLQFLLEVAVLPPIRRTGSRF